MQQRKRVSKSYLVAVLITLSVGTTGVAMAGTVTGSLTVPSSLGSAPESTLPAFFWEEPNGAVRTGNARANPARELAVVLVGELTSGERPASNFAFRGGDLMPSTMIAQAGTTLRIENTDPCSHELFAEGVEGFGPLATAPGNPRTVTLPGQPGSFPLRDRLYAHVTGHLHIVSDLVARATLDATGRFQFEDVPPGNYTLKVFHGANELASQAVEVPDGQLTIEDPIGLASPAGGQ